MLLAGGGVDLITAFGGALNIVLDSPPNRNYDISFGSAKRSKVDKKSTVFSYQFKHILYLWMYKDKGRLIYFKLFMNKIYYKIF